MKNNKPSIILVATAFALVILGLFSSCNLLPEANKYVDVAVKRSEKKGSTDTEDIYPSSAFRPVLNTDRINETFQKGVDKANDKLAEISPVDPRNGKN